MESRVYWFFMICYVVCILRKNALGELTSTKVSSSIINNISQLNAETFKTKNIRTVQLIKTETRLNEIMSKNDLSKKFDIQLEFLKNLLEMIQISTNFLKARCFARYYIQLEINKNNSVFEDINLLFTENRSKKDNFLLDNCSNINIIRHISINNKNFTIYRQLCQKKKLVHNLSKYNKINFYINANGTEIIINNLGNLSRAILTTSKINTKKIFNKILDKDIQSKERTININKETKQFNNLRKDTLENIDNNQKTNIYICNISVINFKINGRPKFARIFKRSAEIMNEKETNNDKAMEDDILLPSVESTFAHARTKNIMNYSIFSLRNSSLMSYGDIKIPQNITSKNNKAFNGNIFALEQQQKIQSRSSEIASLNEDIDTNNVKLSTKDNILIQIQNNDQDFSTQFAENIGDFFERKKILLEINAKSNLIASPGTTHRVLFDVTNNCMLPVRYAIRARSSPFRILSIQPIYLWLYPGRTSYVAIDIIVPSGTQDTVNTLTLLIDGTEIPEKTVYVYVQNAISKSIDDIKPTLEYSFNSNCAGKLNKDLCEKTFWSADITVQDSDSGLKRVISTPNRLYLHNKFISGTKDRVKFYYLSNCCSTTATITAIDISDNQYSRTIDVTAWDNLSQGEIAAIVLGVLLFLFLIIFLIIAIIYCVRRKNSHDLPYTQRYGSRPPARSERTSF